jgi:hypothetical protein
MPNLTEKQMINEKPKKKEKKTPTEDRHISLARVIDGKLGLADEKFPVNFFKVKNPGGKKTGKYLIVEQVDDSGIVVSSCRDEMIEVVLKYCSVRPFYGVANKRDASSVVDWWSALTDQIEMPPPYLWLDEYGLTFARLPWVRGCTGGTPDWDALLGRMSNSRAYMAWVGSLFFPNSYKQQYVWLHGDGGDGKGVMGLFFGRVLGEAFMTTAQPPRGDGARFWTHGLIGKRLVLFPELEDPRFVTSGTFKMFTGDDAIPVEEKNGGRYSVLLCAKYLFFSNTKPEISSQDSDTRRIIFCEMQKYTGEKDTKYIERLWAEGGSFLAKCMATYLEMCPSDGIIEADLEATADLVDESESQYEGMFDTYFTYDLNRPSEWVTGSVIDSVLRNDGFRSFEVREFKAYLKRRNCERKTWFPGSHQYRGVVARGEKRVIVRESRNTATWQSNRVTDD